MNADALILIASMVGLCSVVGAAVTLRPKRPPDDLPGVRLSDWENGAYAWKCWVCGHANEGNDCDGCGCPAEVSYHYTQRRGQE